MYAIEVLGEGGTSGTLHPLGPSPTYLGRGPQNDLCVLDPTVSGRHLAVWVAEGLVFVEDLGSRNGTHVLGKRIAGIVRVQPGDDVLAGEGTRLRILREPSNIRSDPGLSWAVEDAAANVRYPVRSDRFRIGGGADDDLVVAGMPSSLGTLLFHRNGEIWLGIDDGEREISAGEPFVVGDRTLVVRPVPVAVSVTIEREETRYPYLLTVDMHAAGGPYAEVEHEFSGVKHRLVSQNRAVLLYLLAKKREEDEAAGVDVEEAGWCDDYDVMIGIWGKTAADAPLSKLNTLVCRLRAELREGGFDPWFIEKRRGATRARMSAVKIAS